MSGFRDFDNLEDVVTRLNNNIAGDWSGTPTFAKPGECKSGSCKGAGAAINSYLSKDRATFLLPAPGCDKNDINVYWEDDKLVVKMTPTAIHLLEDDIISKDERFSFDDVHVILLDASKGGFDHDRTEAELKHGVLIINIHRKEKTTSEVKVR